MDPLTREQIVVQLADFIIATVKQAANNPARKWALFQEIRGVLQYAATLNDPYLVMDVKEEVYDDLDLYGAEHEFRAWEAYNA